MPIEDLQVGKLNVPVEFDTTGIRRDGARKLKDQLESAGTKAGTSAGEKIADGILKSLEREFEAKKGAARVAFEKGLIDRRELDRLGRKAGAEFNAGLLSAIDGIRTRGGGRIAGDAERVLSNRFKDIGEKSGSLFGSGLSRGIRRAVVAIAAFFAASRVAVWLRDWARAGIEATNSLLKLSATSKLFGVEQRQLNELVRTGREEYRLSLQAARSLAAVTAKLAARSGDASKAQELYARALDLGAAQGLTAVQTAEALEQALRELDEGTDKLLQLNPIQIYKEYAQGIGKTVAALTDQERKQALVNKVLEQGLKVQGEYQRQLDTDVGTLKQWRTLLEDSAQTIGTALVPILATLAGVLEGPLRGGVELFTDFLDTIDRITDSPLENLIRDMKRVGIETEALARAELALRRIQLHEELRGLQARQGRRITDPRVSGIGIGARRNVEGKSSTQSFFDLSGVGIKAIEDEVDRVTARIESLSEGASRADARQAKRLADYQQQLLRVIADRERELGLAKELNEVEEDLQAIREGRFSASGAAPTSPSTPDPTDPADVKRFEAKVAEFLRQLDGLTATASDDLLRQIDKLEQEVREAAEKAGMALPEGFEEGLRRLRGNAAAQKRLEELREEFTRAARLDRGAAELHALDLVIQKLELESQLLEEGSAAKKAFNELLERAIDLRNREAEAIERQSERTDEQTERDEAAAAREELRNLREKARLIEENARAAVQLANAFGLVSDDTARALENIAQLGGAIARIAGGDLSAIPSAIGAVAQLAKGLFGADDKARQEEIQAMRDLESALREAAATLRGDLSGRERKQLEHIGKEVLLSNGKVEATGAFGQFAERIRELTGIDVLNDDQTFNVDRVRDALQALKEFTLGVGGDDLIGRLDALDLKFRLLGEHAGTAEERFADFMKVLDKDPRADAFQKRLQAKLQREGVAKTQDMVREMIAELLDPERRGKLLEGGIFDQLSADEALRLLEETKDLLDERLGVGPGGTTQDFVQARSITELTGTRIEGALFSLQALTAQGMQLDVTRNQLLAQLLSGGGPSVASLIQLPTGGGGASFRVDGPLFGSMTVQSADGVIDEARMAAQVDHVVGGKLERIVSKVNRELGAERRRQLRARGRT